MYGGRLQLIATLLLLGGFFAVLASAFRFGGDLFVQYMWGESVLDLVLAITTLIVAYNVRLQFREVTRLFGMDKGDKQE